MWIGAPISSPSAMISQIKSFPFLVLTSLKWKSDKPVRIGQERAAAAAATPFVVEIEGLDERSSETIDRRRYCAQLHAGAEVKLLKEGNIIHVVHLDRVIGRLPSNDRR